MFKVFFIIFLFKSGNFMLQSLFGNLSFCVKRDNDNLQAKHNKPFQPASQTDRSFLYYDKNLIQDRSIQKQRPNGIYGVFRETIQKCIQDNSIYAQITEENKIGEGSQAKIYRYGKKVLKVPKNPKSLTDLQKSTSEFELMRQYHEEAPDLFLPEVDCYFENFDKYPYFIISMPLLGDNLAYQPDLQISGGEKLFQIEKLQNDVRQRFKIYLQLFQQLNHFYDNLDVHSDIKPENIMTNYPLEDFIQQRRSIEELKLYIIDFGLVDDEESYQFTGTLNFMHPLYYSKRVIEKLHKHDVYQLCLTLLIIETYQFGMNDDFIFEMISNKSQNQLIEEIEQSRKNGQSQRDQKPKILTSFKKKEIYMQTLQSYRQFFVDQFMQDEHQMDFMEQYQNYDRSKFPSFYQKYCLNNFHCILILCLSDDIKNIPSAPNLLNLLEELLIDKKKVLI